MSQIQKNILVENQYIQELFGQYDKNMQKIERAFSVSYIYRGDKLTISGETSRVEKAETVIQDLLAVCRNGNQFTIRPWIIPFRLLWMNHLLSPVI